jgi:hypothetical protein
VELIRLAQHAPIAVDDTDESFTRASASDNKKKNRMNRNRDRTEFTHRSEDREVFLRPSPPPATTNNRVALAPAPATNWSNSQTLFMCEREICCASSVIDKFYMGITDCPCPEGSHKAARGLTSNSES